MLMLLIRALFFLALVFAGVAFWRAMQPDKRLVVPSSWTAAARGVPWLADALALRGKIAKKIVGGNSASGEGLLADVDGVMSRLVEIADATAQAEELRGEVGDRLAESIARLKRERTQAVQWLTEAYAVLVESAASEFDAAAARMHGSLAAHKEELRHEVEAQREINQALKH